MSLNRTRVVEAAAARLAEQGLAGLSMRALAKDLGVAPGALYHHVESKQELLAAVGERLLGDGAATTSGRDPVEAALAIRAALLPIRDGAEVLSFVHAYRPGAIGPFRDLHLTLIPPLPEADARAGAEALIRFILGWVAVEQNRAELIRARILTPSRNGADIAAFRDGVDALLRGLAELRRPTRPGRGRA